MLAQTFLAHAEKFTPHPNAAADMKVDRIGGFIVKRHLELLLD